MKLPNDTTMFKQMKLMHITVYMYKYAQWRSLAEPAFCQKQLTYKSVISLLMLMHWWSSGYMHKIWSMDNNAQLLTTACEYNLRMYSENAKNFTSDNRVHMIFCLGKGYLSLTCHLPI